MMYPLKNIVVLILILCVVVLAAIHLVHPSLLRSAASRVDCAAKHAQLRRLLSQEQFTVMGNVEQHKKLSSEIHSLRKELHKHKCLTDEEYYMSVSRQSYRLYLGMLSWSMTPMDVHERNKLSASPVFSYMQKHLSDLANETEAQMSKYKCAVLHMEKEENHHWLKNHPFGKSAEGKANEEHYRVAMAKHTHEAMVEAKCILPAPSVKHMTTRHA